MKIKTHVIAVVGLLSAFGTIGIINTAQAEGVSGLSFVVNAKQLGGRLLGNGGKPGPNCYTFLEDGTWIDPLFLAPFPGFLFPGEWVQDSMGATTRYTASAESPFIPDSDPGDEIDDSITPLLLIQDGQITPGFAPGQQRLKAISTLYIVDPAAEGRMGLLLAEFVSAGDEGFDDDLCLSDVL
jgi:hypothetical protein